MKLFKTIRSPRQFALIALALSGFALHGFAQPTPAKTGLSPSPGPGGPGSPFMSPSAIPGPILQGIISPEESKAYMAFQQQINDDPAIKDLNAKIAKLTKEIQQLRAESNATREKLIAANPEMKKIQEKIMTAMHSRTSNGPLPMPSPNVPMPPPGKSN